MTDVASGETPASDVLAAWASAYQPVLQGSLGLHAPYFLTPAVHNDAGLTIHQLSASCFLSSESALFLIARGRLWDAEILVRAVFEGTLKLAYLCVPDEPVRTTRHREFAYDLMEIGRLRSHERAQEALALWGRDHEATRPLTDMLLSEEQAAEIRATYPSNRRNELAQRWSFTGLVRALEDDEPEQVRGLKSLLHGYRMSSHLIHKDVEGVGMVWEREERELPRREAVTRSHGARLCSDIHAMLRFRLNRMYASMGMDPAPLDGLERMGVPLVRQWKDSYDAWHRIEYDT